MSMDLIDVFYKVKLQLDLDVAIRIDGVYRRCYFGSNMDNLYLRVYNNVVKSVYYYISDMQFLNENVYLYKGKDILSLYLYLGSKDSYESMYHELDPTNPNLIPITLVNIAKLKMEREEC